VRPNVAEKGSISEPIATSPRPGAVNASAATSQVPVGNNAELKDAGTDEAMIATPQQHTAERLLGSSTADTDPNGLGNWKGASDQESKQAGVEVLGGSGSASGDISTLTTPELSPPTGEDGFTDFGPANARFVLRCWGMDEVPEGVGVGDWVHFFGYQCALLDRQTETLYDPRGSPDLYTPLLEGKEQCWVGTFRGLMRNERNHWKMMTIIREKGSPEAHFHDINPRGVQVDKQFYPYETRASTHTWSPDILSGARDLLFGQLSAQGGGRGTMPRHKSQVPARPPLRKSPRKRPCDNPECARKLQAALEGQAAAEETGRDSQGVIEDLESTIADLRSELTTALANVTKPKRRGGIQQP
jgi:hypothetical protein